MAINWTKIWSAVDDGTILKGIDLRNIQDDIDANAGDAEKIHGFDLDIPTALDDNKFYVWDNDTSSFVLKYFVDDDGSLTADSGERVPTQDAVKDYADTKISKATAGEISEMTEKVDLVDDDLILIEDSEASNAKKKVKRSSLIVGVDLTATFRDTISDVTAATGQASSPTEKLCLGATAAKRFEVTLKRAGSFTVSFQMKTTNAPNGGVVWAYKNGSSYATLQSEATTLTTSYQSFSYNTTGWAKDDVMAIWCQGHRTNVVDVYVQNMTITESPAILGSFEVTHDS